MLSRPGGASADFVTQPFSLLVTRTGNPASSHTVQRRKNRVRAIIVARPRLSRWNREANFGCSQFFPTAEERFARKDRERAAGRCVLYLFRVMSYAEITIRFGVNHGDTDHYGKGQPGEGSPGGLWRAVRTDPAHRGSSPAACGARGGQ